MLPIRDSYEALRRDFRWQIPPRFNMAAACLARAATDGDAPAILHARQVNEVETWTFSRLARESARLANTLQAHGIFRGDRIAVLLPQIPQTAVAHLAAWRLGAVSVPMSVLFGIDALSYRLGDCGAAALVTTRACAEKVSGLRQDLEKLRLVISVDGPGEGTKDWQALLEQGADRQQPADTGPDDPALMVYTSGTTGQPKGALHGHRVLLGHLPGIEFSHEFLPRAGDRLWTPADWAWAGGLLNLLLPGLYLGVPVLAYEARKFDPDAALALMAAQGVRNAFIPPTALKILRSVPQPGRRHDLKLRTVASGGESLGRETLEWGRAALGLTINELYGQTECNYVLASCGALGISKPGAIGPAVPGHEVAIMDGAGQPLPPGSQGQIAVKAPDPVMFLQYWGRPDATQDKFIGPWMMTGDQGVADEDGYVTFVGRDDDVITSSGYRIGPGEIEDCLIGHPAVRLAAAIGKPDPVRTEIVKAYVVLRDGYQPSEALAAEISAWVRERLSAHEYPREVAFVDSMPLTTSGKVIRRHFREDAGREAAKAEAPAAE